MEKCELFDRVWSCKEKLRRNVRCLFKLGIVRSLFKLRYSIELKVRNLLEVFRGIRLS